VILPSECPALDEGAITTYFKRLRFDAAGPSRAQTHDLPYTEFLGLIAQDLHVIDYKSKAINAKHKSKLQIFTRNCHSDHC
jgi:hypothetical protein